MQRIFTNLWCVGLAATLLVGCNATESTKTTAEKPSDATSATMPVDDGVSAHKDSLHSRNGLQTSESRLATPMRLEADGGPIDIGKLSSIAHAGPWIADVDGDGDRDILIGSFGGELFRRMNIGTRGEPKYSGESIVVHANDSPLKETGHADPVVADWDGDGRWDLVIGSADGSVGWYRNIGTASNPQFSSRNMLVRPAAEAKFLEQNLKADEKPAPGVRAQICVTDYNGDGLLDLIVGDYSDINWTKVLTSTEQTQFQEHNTREAELAAALEQVRAVMFAEDTDESLKTLKRAEYRKIANEYQQAREERKAFYVDSRCASFIWLYLRKSPAEADVAKTF